MNLEVEAIVLSKQCDIRTVQDPNQFKGRGSITVEKQGLKWKLFVNVLSLIGIRLFHYFHSFLSMLFQTHCLEVRWHASFLISILFF